MTYSFDIFDTLLLRPYTDPQEVWRVLEEQEGAKGFAKARKQGDAQSYRISTKEGRETSIEEAYDLMPMRYLPLMQKEMDLERRVLRANPEMVEFWNELGRQGQRRVIVSDMYLPQGFIEAILRENGIDGWDAFYMSRTHNARKTTGRLFEIMLKDQSVQPSEVLHIGDNAWSDVEVPKRMGIQVQPYKRVAEQLYTDFPFMRKVNMRLAGALAIGWQEYKRERPNYTYWNKLGFSMGGALGYLYASWIVSVAKQRGINHLMFVARDGYIWEKTCNQLYPEIKTDYFYAPRLTSIAVLGATGNDPVAIADRQRYMEEHLQGVNPEDVRKRYAEYLGQFNIDEHTALVDGCSSGFSAQRLVEAAVGHPIFTFYLMSMARLHNAGALFQTKGYSLPFQMLSEFLFGSPEKPIKDVTTEGPIYNENLSDEESFKIGVSEEIAEGAITCAKLLHKMGLSITTDDWINYSTCFVENLTEKDQRELEKARNAGDVEQCFFNAITWKPYKKFQFWTEKWGRATFYFYLIVLNNKFRLKIGRGIEWKSVNMNYKSRVINE